MTRRIDITASCRDSDAIPKVANAGEILTVDGCSVQIMHNDVRVLAGGYHGDWMAEIIRRLRGHHEPQEELVFHEILKHVPAKASMIELGGFWSYYSLWFLSHAPALRKSIVLEPDSNNLQVGRKNAALNERSIEFIQGFVGPRSTGLCTFMTETAGEVMIPQIAVPDLMRDRGISHLDILHCDTQGAEVDVIKSCELLLRDRRVRFVVVSTHAHQITGDPLTHQRCLELLCSFGGQILAEHDVHESFSGDGLIAAYFGAEALAWPHLPLSYNRYSTSLFPNPLYDLSTSLQEIAALKQQRDDARTEKDRLSNRPPAVCSEIKDARSSTSWRGSLPMRLAGRLVKRGLGRSR